MSDNFCIEQKYIDGELVISVNDVEYLITPDILSQAWILYETKNFNLIRPKCNKYDGLKQNIYDKIISNEHIKSHTIGLIALLLLLK